VRLVQPALRLTSRNNNNNDNDSLTGRTARFHQQLNALDHCHRAKRRPSGVQNHDERLTFRHIRRDRRFPQSKFLSERLDTAKQQPLLVGVVGGIRQFHFEVRKRSELHFQTRRLVAVETNGWKEYVDFAFVFQVHAGLLNSQRQIYNCNITVTTFKAKLENNIFTVLHFQYYTFIANKQYVWTLAFSIEKCTCTCL